MCILFIGFSISDGWSQFYAPYQPPISYTYPIFNADFVSEQRIRSIRTEVIYKAPMRELRFSNESDRFYFSRNGDVEKWVRRGKYSDSTVTTYFLDNTGNLSSEMVKSKNMETLKSFRYNDKGHIMESEHTDVQESSKSYTENFSYEYLTDTQYKKYWLNSEGLTYKFSVIDLDESQKIKEERTRYIRDATRETTIYKYENGLLVSYAVNVKQAYRRETKYVMIYDSENQIIEMNKYIDGAHVQHSEFLYDNGLVSAVLEKTIKTQQIKITKYKYSFWL